MCVLEKFIKTVQIFDENQTLVLPCMMGCYLRSPHPNDVFRSDGERVCLLQYKI